MKVRGIFRTLIILTVLCANIGCDQISKNIAREALDYDEPISVVENHLTLMKVENTGAFLSVGHALPKPIKSLLLTIIPVIILALATVYVLTGKHSSTVTLISIAFVVGGGIGNIYDRLIHGSVTDFLHLDFGLFQTGIFNMADVSIMAGMLAILVDAGVTQSRSGLKTGDKKQGDV